MKTGYCTKCGKYGIVRMHHWKGYSDEHKDDVMPYCQSCDQKAHYTAKKNGLCTLSSYESHKKSRNSYNRRHIIKYTISENSVYPNIAIRERIYYNTSTQSTTSTYEFVGYHGTKLKHIHESIDKV